jgi:hypothetical protein
MVAKFTPRAALGSVSSRFALIFVWAVIIGTTRSVAAQVPQQAPLTDFTRLKDGDIVFIESNSKRAPAIKALKGSILTHCGIVFQDNGKGIVYEGARNPGVYSELGKWTVRESGEGKHPIVPRLTDQARLTAKLADLRKRAKELHDTSYDIGFAWKNRDGKGTEYIYCSELVWKAFNDAIGVELGKPHPLSDYINHPPEGRASGDIEKDFDKWLNDPESQGPASRPTLQAG